MDRMTFQDNYKLSRGQVDRLLAKSKVNGGCFELPGSGVFQVKKGPGKTSPVEITPVRQAVSGPVKSAGPAVSERSAAEFSERASLPAELAGLPKAELDRLLTAANILKVRQATESERRRIRAEVLSELVTSISLAFSDLRRVLEELRLPADQLDRLRSALLSSLDRLREVTLGN